MPHKSTALNMKNARDGMIITVWDIELTGVPPPRRPTFALVADRKSPFARTTLAGL